MNNRERLLTALKRCKPDKVPKSFDLCPSQVKKFREKTGKDDYYEYFDFEFRPVDIRLTKLRTDFTRYLGSIPENIRIDEWGIGHWQKNPDVHFERLLHPMKGFKSCKEIGNYPFPDVDAEYRYENLATQVNSLKQAGLATMAYVEPIGGTVLWTAYKLRGMENLFVDFMLNKDFAAVLLDKVTDLLCAMARGYAKTGVDIIELSDDLGSQKSMLISPAIFREWIKKRLLKIIQSIRKINPEVCIVFDSDGYIEPIIPDLIEIGVDVLKPVQPECMDPAKLKKLYGNKIAFWGTIGTQTTMPFGTPEDVKKIVKLRIETVGKNGGLLIAPTHLIEPEVPWENIIAFAEAVEECGYY